MMIFDKVRNIVGKEENAGSKHFVLSHNVFYPIGEKIGSFEPQ